MEMQSEGFQQNMQEGSVKFNHGAHEVLDIHEVLSGTISLLEQFTLFRANIKDQELLQILDNQHRFMLDEYNMMVQAFSTGQDPTHGTKRYQISKQSNETITYGLKPSASKKPKQAVNEINDQCYAGFMIGLMKGMVGQKSMAAVEVTNPVVRRVLADSIPNCIEMCYEIFLWQNKHGYYQVPQFDEQTMQSMIQAYAPTQPMAPH
jgi:spore coat protein CotF